MAICLATMTREFQRTACSFVKTEVPIALRTTPRIYVGMTTVKNSAKYARVAISSILDQTLPPTAVLLSVSTETKAAMPDIHMWPNSSRIKVLASEEDQGPAMKYMQAIGLLRSEENALIVIVDDDKIYPPTMLQDLLRGYEKEGPGSAVGCRGWTATPDCTYPRDGWELGVSVYGHKSNASVNVDVLTGSDSYIFKPSVFRDDSLWQTCNDTLKMAMRMDDVWISGNLARLGIKRKVVPCRAECTDIQLDSVSHGRIEHHNNLHGMRRHVINTILLQHFCDSWGCHRERCR